MFVRQLPLFLFYCRNPVFNFKKYVHFSKMANSKYEYVKQFETEDKCLPNSWIVVRLDGRAFHKFADKHNFKKPNDERSLKLMACAAKTVMKDFKDIVIAFGQSDEFSFVFRRETEVYNRRCNKLLTYVCSLFTSSFVFHWGKFFVGQELLYPPAFDGRVVLYPTNENLKDYLAWRQADVHVNNLYNTCFWNLVLKKQLTNQMAEEKLRGTFSSDKNELLFSEFGINYNNEPQEFRKGTTIVKTKGKLEAIHVDIIGDGFWNENPHILNNKLKILDVKKDKALQTVIPTVESTSSQTQKSQTQVFVQATVEEASISTQTETNIQTVKAS